MWLSLSGFFLVELFILSFSIVPWYLWDLCLQDLLQRWGLNWAQPNCPQLHVTFSGFLRGRLLLAASILSFPFELAPSLLHLGPSVSWAHCSLLCKSQEHQAFLYALLFVVFPLALLLKNVCFSYLLYLPDDFCLWPWSSDCSHSPAAGLEWGGCPCCATLVGTIGLCSTACYLPCCWTGLHSKFISKPSFFSGCSGHRIRFFRDCPLSMVNIKILFYAVLLY